MRKALLVLTLLLLLAAPATASAALEGGSLTPELVVKAFLNDQKYQLSGGEFTYDVYQNGDVVGFTKSPGDGQKIPFGPLYASGDEAGLCETNRTDEMVGFILQGDHEGGCVFDTMNQDGQQFKLVYKKYVPIRPYLTFQRLKDERVHPGSLTNFWLSIGGNRIDKLAVKLVSRNLPRMLKLKKPDPKHPFITTDPFLINPPDEPTLTDYGPPNGPVWLRKGLHDSPVANRRNVQITWRIPRRAKSLNRGTRICFTLGVKARGSTKYVDTGVIEPWTSDVNSLKFCYRKAGRRS